MGKLWHTDSPYFIEGPALISFSGGRTSAFMLHEILQAYGGALPEDVVVAFANTGKEREETLRFVQDCGLLWGVPIHWVERRLGGGVRRVDYGSASRHGEPFAALIREKQALPNWQARWCTSGLKVAPMHQLMAGLGFFKFQEAVGLRADEPWRVAKMLGRNLDEGRFCVAPLARAGVTKTAVLQWWSEQPFDLQLEAGEGNCDFCFMKGRGLRRALVRRAKTSPAWWSAQEIERGRTFDRRGSVAALIEEAADRPELSLPEPGEDDHDAECDLLCGDAA